MQEKEKDQEISATNASSLEEDPKTDKENVVVEQTEKKDPQTNVSENEPLVLKQEEQVPLTETSKWDFSELEKALDSQSKKLEEPMKEDTQSNDLEDDKSKEKPETAVKKDESVPEATSLESDDNNEKEKEIDGSVSIPLNDTLNEKPASTETNPLQAEDKVNPIVESSVEQDEIVSEIKKLEEEKHHETESDKSVKQESEHDDSEFYSGAYQVTRSTKQSEPEPSVELKAEETQIKAKVVNSSEGPEKSKKRRTKLIVGLVALLLIGGTAVTYWASEGSLPGSSLQAVEEKPGPQMFKLTAGDQKFEVDLLTMGYDGKNVSTIDQAKLRAWLDDVKKQVDQPVVNAKQKKLGAEIQPEKPGKLMDTKLVNSWLSDLPSLINKPKEIPFIDVEPQITTEDLKQVDQKLIGNYTTRFDAGNTNRTTNIKLASKAINGIILNPGEQFSFNKVVGERTASRGYKPAHVIVNGEFSEGIGGGICQVSSTLYNSVDEANIKIVARRSHSKEVTYVPPGRDATVSWGGPDFKFKNNLNKPITIKIAIRGGTLQIQTFTVPGAKVSKKKVEPAPQNFSEMTVDPTKPTDVLSPEDNTNN